MALDSWLLIRILAFATATRVLGRFNPLLLRRLLTRKPAAHSVDTGDQISRIASQVDLALRVGRPFVPRGCLTRGLTLYHFVSGAGVDVKLKFGLAHADTRYDGHCWLEKDGVPILERVDPRPRFQVMFTIP